MELFAAPPVELAAIADPSARGAAPLLRPPGEGGPAPPPAVPFELLLGLLTAPMPGGESWPAGGKKLPLPPLYAATESAASTALGPGAFVVPPLAGEPPAVPAGPWQPAAPDSAPFPVAEVPSATARPAPWLLARSAGAAQPPAAQRAAAAPLGAPHTLFPVGAETVPADAAALPSADALPAHGRPELDGLENFFSNDARLRAQPAPAATPEPRAGAASAAPLAAATNVPSALPEAYASSTREKLPLAPGDARRVAALGPLTLPTAGSEAPTGVASDWLPFAHTHAHGTTGTAAAAAPAVPHAPVDTRLPDWQEAFAQRVQWVVDTDAGEARIKLNPPELGAVDVKISLVDDKTHVHLTASTAAARDELAQSLPRLRELFTVSGLELGSASVHDGRGGEHARPGGDHAQHGDGAPRRAAVAPLVGLLDEPAAAWRGPARGRIDVFA